jgi:hypothetical protein
MTNKEVQILIKIIIVREIKIDGLNVSLTQKQ